MRSHRVRLIVPIARKRWITRVAQDDGDRVAPPQVALEGAPRTSWITQLGHPEPTGISPLSGDGGRPRIPRMRFPNSPSWLVSALVEIALTLEAL